MSPKAWEVATRRVETALAAHGLDIVRPFNLATYDRASSGKDPLGIPTRPNALGLLVGNTRALWPAFMAALASDRSLLGEAHPLDAHVQRSVTAAVASCGIGVARLIFAHTTLPAPFPIQRLAEAIGFAALSPSHLAIHPEFGPWFALRAVVVLDVKGPEASTPAGQSPCAGCSAPCVPALERAVAVSGAPLTSASIATHAAAWIAVRDACPVGRAHRYGETQLRYHYAPSAVLLAEGL